VSARRWPPDLRVQLGPEGGIRGLQLRLGCPKRGGRRPQARQRFEILSGRSADPGEGRLVLSPQVSWAACRSVRTWVFQSLRARCSAKSCVIA